MFFWYSKGSFPQVTDFLKILLLPGFSVTMQCIEGVKASHYKLFISDPGNVLVEYMLNRDEDMSRIEIQPPELNERNKASSLRILAADDSIDNRFLLTAFLKGFDCELTVVENGQEAFDAFKVGQFDIVLMDMQMPVLDGFAATGLIRQWEAEHNHSETPILALTAYSLPEEIKQCTDAGCNGHISKPVRKKNLLAVIDDFAK